MKELSTRVGDVDLESVAGGAKTSYNDVNVDALTETYGLAFYLQYLGTWPEYLNGRTVVISHGSLRASTLRSFLGRRVPECGHRGELSGPEASSVSRECTLAALETVYMSDVELGEDSVALH